MQDYKINVQIHVQNSSKIIMKKHIPYPLSMRIRYSIDNFMSKVRQYFSSFLLFTLGFLIMVIIRIIANVFLPDETLASWLEILARLCCCYGGLCSRNVGDSNWAAKLTSIIGVLVGLVLSSMVAFITSVFEGKLELRRGRSLVLEKEHTLILGFGDRIIEIIRELIEANESEQDASIVILADNDKEEMDNIIRDNIIDSRTTRIITRSGVVTNINNLRKVQAEKSKSIIIMNSAASWQSNEECKLADGS